MIVKFQTAVLAKKLGFKQTPTKIRRNYYNPEGELNGDVTKYIKAYVDKSKDVKLFEVTNAPTQDDVKTWLRDKFDTEVEVYRTDVDCDGNKYAVCSEIWKENKMTEDLFNLYYDTYEHALENGLRLTMETL
jgi:hypothetical protein